MDFSGSWIVVAIIGAEIAFWVLLVLGLLARYALKLKRTSTALLLSVPLADLVLIILVSLDLSRGSEPTFVHGLAGAYLGFSVGFGHYIIKERMHGSLIDSPMVPDHHVHHGQGPPRSGTSGKTGCVC